MPNTFAHELSNALPSRTRLYYTLFVRRTARKLLSRVWDRLVRYDLEGTSLLLPLSHDLPVNRAVFPRYATNIQRVAAAILEKYPASPIIDVGANVGDTAAILRRATANPILCIEGEPRFAEILRRNLPRLPNVSIEEAFVGPAAGAYTVSSAGGSAHLTPSTTKGIQTLSLRAILQRHPDFASAKLIKIDTDGFDTRIIRGEAELLATMKPAVFFEYDPYFFERIGEEGLAVFALLRGLGYKTCLVYESWGDFLLSMDLDDTRLVQDVHNYYTGRGGYRYCDISVFHEEDDDVAASARRMEIEFLHATRGR